MTKGRSNQTVKPITCPRGNNSGTIYGDNNLHSRKPHSRPVTDRNPYYIFSSGTLIGRSLTTIVCKNSGHNYDPYFQGTVIRSTEVRNSNNIGLRMKGIHGYTHDEVPRDWYCRINTPTAIYKKMERVRCVSFWMGERVSGRSDSNNLRRWKGTTCACI